MKRYLMVVGLAMASILVACGGGSTTTAAGPTVKITMKDIAFDPTSIQVRRGETVQFEFKNSGAVVHEAFIGDEAAQESHSMEMSSSSSGTESSMQGTGSDGMGDHNGGADASKMLTVEPGKTGKLSYTFPNAGTFIIGCHQPGHYEAGMKVTVTVQ